MSKVSTLNVEFERPLTDDPYQSFTLPSRYYTDPAIYELEKEKIFYRNWNYVCHINQIPDSGDYFSADIAGQPVFVIRDKGGQINAFYNVCQHRGHELVGKSGSIRSRIVCPYHAWAYGTDGDLLHARNCDALKGFDKSDFGLKKIRVETLANLVFVNLDPEATPLADQAPNLEADIRQNLPYWDELQLTEVYDFGGAPIEAGWKVVVDNYIECYHCEPAHPQFADLICMTSYQHTIDGITARQKGHDVRIENSAYTMASDAEMPHSIFWYLWPTMTINVLPGNGDCLLVEVKPMGPLRSRFAVSRFSRSPEPDDPERRNYIENILGLEDLKLCESSQRGLLSKGFDQGRFVVDSDQSGISEHVVHWFHKMVKDALEG